MIQVRNMITEMKNDSDGLIARMATAKEKLSELEDMWIETSN